MKTALKLLLPFDLPTPESVRDWVFGIVGILGAIWVAGLANGSFLLAIPLFVGFLALYIGAIWGTQRLLRRFRLEDE